MRFVKRLFGPGERPSKLPSPKDKRSYYFGETVPSVLEKAIQEAIATDSMVERDINGTLMLIDLYSFLGDAHSEGSLMHTYPHSSRAAKEGDYSFPNAAIAHEKVLHASPE